MEEAQSKLSIMGFTLTSSEKLERAMNTLGEGATDKQILAEYDKLGGGIKMGERKVAMGTFWNFDERKPKEGVDYGNLGEDDMEDEMKIVRKKKVRVSSEDNFTRVKKNLDRAINQKTEDDAPKKAKKAKE